MMTMDDKELINATLVGAVSRLAREVIETKMAELRSPACCTLGELMLRLRPAVTETMREMVRRGEYSGHINIAKEPMLMRKETDL
ncbi:MAG: hypothetical protein NC342_08835 [Pseudoflavonifractor sp.]|nr:hypothetical protein [Alloprevotella sp.]MCM1117626.1 hypothetical protein [Pseudoflavonifractor sp.]